MNLKIIKFQLKIEEFFLFLFSIYLFSLLNFSWWWFIILLLIPDISMIGYLKNNTLGAITYNLVHNRGLSILIYLLGVFLTNEIIQLVGIILFAHISLDRTLGYGLKLNHFKNTHLGKINQ